MRTRRSPRNQDILFSSLFKPTTMPTKTIDKRKPCVWQENEDGVWNTNCDNAHEFIAGSPNDNNYRYCPYCGRYLKSLNYSNGSLSCLPNTTNRQRESAHPLLDGVDDGGAK